MGTSYQQAFKSQHHRAMEIRLKENIPTVLKRIGRVPQMALVDELIKVGVVRSGSREDASLSIYATIQGLVHDGVIKRTRKPGRAATLETL